jgi:hypothetical protein
MRPVTLNYAGISDPAIRAALAEIERASHEMNPVDIAQNFSINGTLTVGRTLNVSAQTLAEVYSVLGTLLRDLQKGGASRTT